MMATFIFSLEVTFVLPKVFQKNVDCSKSRNSWFVPKYSTKKTLFKENVKSKSETEI